MQVRPELIEVSGGGAPTSKWQQPFDAALTDVFQVQSDIATRVAQALGVALGAGEEKQLAERPTQSLPAYEAFLKGEEACGRFSKTDPPSVRRALAFYEQAAALDPVFAQAWARIAIANSYLYSNSAPLPDFAERSPTGVGEGDRPGPESSGWLRGNGRLQAPRSPVDHPASAGRNSLKGRSLSPGNPKLLRASSDVEITLGQWDARAEAPARRAAARPAFDALLQTPGMCAAACGGTRKPARQFDVGLALSPDNLAFIERPGDDLSRGRGPRRCARLPGRAPESVVPTELVAYSGGLLGSRMGPDPGAAGIATAPESVRVRR